MMTPHVESTPRPIRRAPEPRAPYVPPGAARVLDALRPWRHLMKPGSCEVLAFSLWADLQALADLRRLDEEIVARLSRLENRKHLIQPFSFRDRVGDPPDERHGPRMTALWMPPAGVEGGRPR